MVLIEGFPRKGTGHGSRATSHPLTPVRPLSLGWRWRVQVVFIAYHLLGWREVSSCLWASAFSSWKSNHLLIMSLSQNKVPYSCHCNSYHPWVVLFPTIKSSVRIQCHPRPLVRFVTVSQHSQADSLLGYDKFILQLKVSGSNVSLGCKM